MYTPHQFVDSNYLTKMARIIARIKSRSYELLDLCDTSKVLDVGCGAGIDTIEIADKIQPLGKIAGLDFDLQMLKEANRTVSSTGLQNTIHVQGDSLNLPFKNCFFDAVRSERMLQHINRPESAIREMVRVCKQHGSVVVVDSDHSSLSIDTTHTDVEWKIRQFRTDYLPNGYCGRALYRQLHLAGLHDIKTELFAETVNSYQLYRTLSCMDTIERAAIEDGCVTQEEVVGYNTELHEYDLGGYFGASMVFVVAWGNK